MATQTDNWKHWLDENADRFLLFTRQQTRCESDAEDVLQDALVETWIEPQIETGDEARLLESAVRQLRFEYAEVLTLKIWGGLTFREIAATLDIPQNTAASRYRYAIADLRNCLKGVLQ